MSLVPEFELGLWNGWIFVLPSLLVWLSGLIVNKDKWEEERARNFYRCVVGEFRGNKQAYYGHFSEKTMNLVKDVSEELKPRTASHYFLKAGYVAAKYVRKFAFDKMIELEIPESVADFIEGRVPKRIGAKHYMALARQASKFYPRYVKYIQILRESVKEKN